MSRVPHVWLARAALCVLTALPYANTFDADFVFDSRAIVLGDPRIRAVTPQNLRAIGGQSYWGSTLESPLYRPATTASFLFNYAVLGNQDRPAGYHAVNLLLHLTNVLLVFAIGRRLTGASWPAAGVAAIWAVHPLLSEAVTNIVGRADLLAALGVLGGLYAYLMGMAGPRRVGWLGLSVAAAALAMFSKESGVVLLGIVIAYDLLLRHPVRPVSRLLPVWLLLAAPMVSFLFLRTTIPTHSASELVFVDNPMAGASVPMGVLTALGVAGRYLWLLAWPRGLSPDYSYAQIPLFGGRQDEWLAVATVCGVVGVTLVVVLARTNRLVLFLAVATVIAFLPVSNLLFSTGTIMAERLIYLPTIGVIACAAAVLGKIETPYATPFFIMTPLLVALVGVLAVGTWLRNPVWRSELSLWTSAIEAAPNSFKVHSSFAEALYQANPGPETLPRAAAAADRSIAILDTLPDDRRAPGVYRQAASYQFENGDLLRQRGNPKDAAVAYRRSAGLLQRYLALLGTRPAFSTERADAQRMLSAALVQLDEGAGAVEAARLALEREPFNAANYRAAAAALIQARRFDEAAVVLTTGVMVTGNPDLRAASLDLYRGGLDTDGCAVSTKAGAPVLNPECPVVRRHICAAAVDAITIQQAAGRGELAGVIQQSVIVAFGCR